jgi:hypothetical protein
MKLYKGIHFYAKYNSSSPNNWAVKRKYVVLLVIFIFHCFALSDQYLVLLGIHNEWHISRTARVEKDWTQTRRHYA